MLVDWIVPRCNQWWIYSLRGSVPDRISLGLIGSFEIWNVVCGRPLDLLASDFQPLRDFTSVVHEAVFGTPFPDLNFDLFYCLVRNGEILWDVMHSCVNPPKAPALDLDESQCPCIVWSSTASRLQRVESTILKSPYEYSIHLNAWGREAELSRGTIKTLADFYQDKYEVTVGRDQHILVGHLGLPVVSQPLSAYAKMLPRKKKDPSESTIYLIPELVSRHPLTTVQDELSRLQQDLFWIESGLIARRLEADLLVPELGCVFSSLVEIFIPRGIRQFNSKIIMLLHVATTCPGAQLTYSYERMEWLGDAVWKFVASLAGFSDSKVRANFGVLISNERMGNKVATQYPLLHESCVLSNPPCLKSPQAARGRLKNFKILADVVEALIAVSFITGGMRAASHTVAMFGLLNTDDLEGSMSSDRVESFFNRAVVMAYRGLHASIALLLELPNASVGELTEKRKTRSKESPNIVLASTMFTHAQWDAALLEENCM